MQEAGAPGGGGATAHAVLWGLDPHLGATLGGKGGVSPAFLSPGASKTLNQKQNIRLEISFGKAFPQGILVPPLSRKPDPLEGTWAGS